MGPLFNPITLLFALFLLLPCLLVMALPIPIISIGIGICYHVLSRRQRAEKIATAILVAVLVATVLFLLLIPSAYVVFLVLWIVAGFFMVS
jgi:hypothetical protein